MMRVSNAFGRNHVKVGSLRSVRTEMMSIAYQNFNLQMDRAHVAQVLHVFRLQDCMISKSFSRFAFDAVLAYVNVCPVDMFPLPRNHLHTYSPHTIVRISSCIIRSFSLPYPHHHSPITSPFSSFPPSFFPKSNQTSPLDSPFPPNLIFS